VRDVRAVLLAELSQLDFNWIVSFLSDRTQAVVAQGVVSSHGLIRLACTL